MPDPHVPSLEDFFADYPRVPRPVKKIVMYPKIQPDTAVGLYLLQSFGEALFPGVRQAPLEFWLTVPADKDPRKLEEEGVLFLDIGKGLFDHHAANAKMGKRVECMSTVVAKYLNIDTHPALKKILTWTKRNDLEGGSGRDMDPLDRAFSIENLLMLMNREYHEQPERALRVILELMAVHIRSEFHKHVEIPAEWDRLAQAGELTKFTAMQGPAELLGVALISDDLGFASYIRTVKKMDVVVQRRTTGHTNIITKQVRSLDLRPVIAALRRAEAQKKGVPAPVSGEELQSPGRLSGLEEWFYDDGANTIQNGGAYPQGMTPTRLAIPEIIAILQESLPQGRIGWLKRSRAQDLHSNGPSESSEE